MIIIVMAFLIFSLLFTNYKQSLEINELKNELMILHSDKLKMRLQLNSLITAINMRNNDNDGVLQPEICEAVKYAMVHSHPDNGGKSDDFIKFKKLYQSIRKK